MQLAICTDVFADLSYPEMLDHVKSLGIDAVEMTAGGWGAQKHVNTDQLLSDPVKLEAFQNELTKRGMRISALNTSCNPLCPSETGKAYAKSMYDCATRLENLESRRLSRWLACPPALPVIRRPTGSRLRYPVPILWLRHMHISGT